MVSSTSEPCEEPTSSDSQKIGVRVTEGRLPLVTEDGGTFTAKKGGKRQQKPREKGDGRRTDGRARMDGQTSAWHAHHGILP